MAATIRPPNMNNLNPNSMISGLSCNSAYQATTETIKPTNAATSAGVTPTGLICPCTAANSATVKVALKPHAAQVRICAALSALQRWHTH